MAKNRKGYSQLDESETVFELAMCERDSEGNWTGRMKDFKTNKSPELYTFWMRNMVRVKKNKHKNALDAIEKAFKGPDMTLPQKEEAERILKEINDASVEKD